MADRRLRLAMERGEHPFREGHGVYINRTEGRVAIRTADGNLTAAGRLYIARGGNENDTRLFPVDAVPWQQGRNTMNYAIEDRHGEGRAFRISGGRNRRPSGPDARREAPPWAQGDGGRGPHARQGPLPTERRAAGRASTTGTPTAPSRCP